MGVPISSNHPSIWNLVKQKWWKFRGQHSLNLNYYSRLCFVSFHISTKLTRFKLANVGWTVSNYQTLISVGVSVHYQMMAGIWKSCLYSMIDCALFWRTKKKLIIIFFDLISNILMLWAKCMPIDFEFRQGLFSILTNCQTYRHNLIDATC